jgi:hypothetical protein
VLTIANAVGTIGLLCLLKHIGARDNKFLVTHLMANQCSLASTIALKYNQLLLLLVKF